MEIDRILKTLCMVSFIGFIYTLITRSSETILFFLICFTCMATIIKLRQSNKKKANVEENKNMSFEPVVEKKQETIMNLDKKTQEKKDEFNIPKLPKLTIKTKTEIYENNNNLFSITHTIVNKFEDDFPNNLLEFFMKKNNPVLLKFILMDTQKLTFIDYNNPEHLICPVISKASEILRTLQKIELEIENRINILYTYRKKNIKDYNESINDINEILPYIYIIINDIYNAMILDKVVITSLQKIILNGKKAGIIIIGFTNVEEKYLKLGAAKSQIQKNTQVQFWKHIQDLLSQNNSDSINDYYNENRELILLHKYSKEKNKNIKIQKNIESEECDELLYNEIVEFAVKTGKISASLLQRRFQLGYNRAARIVDLLEERGIIGPQNGSKPREVLIKLESKGEEE